MPRGHGNRIVKPRSAAQRAHADAYREKPENVIAILPATAGLPTTSWWTEPRTREEFGAAAAQERARMSESKFSRTLGNSTLESA